MDMIMICITAILAAIVPAIVATIELEIVVATVSSIVYSLQAIARVFTTYHSIEYINFFLPDLNLSIFPGTVQI